MLQATHTDSNGVTTELEGETLQQISAEMAENGLEGTVKVTDAAGWTRGWASAQHWTAN